MTHKEAIEKLENIKKYIHEIFNEILGTTDTKFAECEYIKEVIDLLKSGIWHKYPDEKPNECKQYLVAKKLKYEKNAEIHYDMDKYFMKEGFDSHFVYGDRSAIENIIAWREIPNYESHAYLTDRNLENIEDKIFQEPETLENYGYKVLDDNPYETVYEIGIGHPSDYKYIIYNKFLKNIELNKCVYNIEELETILNKAKELFKEEKDES